MIGCGRTYAWAAGAATTRTAHVRDGLLVSRYDETSKAWQVERVGLGGLCERSTAAERLTLTGGGKRVVAGAGSGTIADAPSGATTTVKRTTGGRAALRVRAGGRIRLTTGAAAASVRWSVAGGRTHRASGRGRAWMLKAPAKPGTRMLRVIVRDRAGGDVTFSVRLTATRR